MTAADNGAGVGNDPPDPISCDTGPQSFLHEDFTVQISNTSDSLYESFNNQKAIVEHKRRKQRTQEEKREQIGQAQRTQEETRCKEVEKLKDDTRQQGADLKKIIKDFLQQQEALQRQRQDVFQRQQEQQQEHFKQLSLMRKDMSNTLQAMLDHIST